MQTNFQDLRANAKNALTAKGIKEDRIYIGSDYVTVSITSEEYNSKAYKYFVPMYAHKDTFYLQYPLEKFSPYKAKNMANFYHYYTSETNAN